VVKIIRVLPCISLTVKEKQIAHKYGFLSYPEFLDNFYITWRTKPDVKHFLRLLYRHSSKIQYAVFTDYLYDTGFALVHKFPHIEWIFPLHRKEEWKYAQQLEWIGYPHRVKFRNYDMKWFLNQTKGYKRWYLGFWNESNPEILLNFDGMDTEIPETYSGKYGKIWYTWNKAEKAPKSIPTIVVLEHNVKNLKQALDRLEKQLILT